jgi:hypothetical protein
MDEKAFANLLGPATSTVQRQPRISELVDEAMKKSNMTRDRILAEKQDKTGPSHKNKGIVSNSSDYRAQSTRLRDI